MTLNRLTFIGFFMLLILSVGIVSVNLPLSSYGQGNTFSQKGENNAGEQEMGQEQSLDQDGQAVSGDTIIASGNNAYCEVQNNSDEVLIKNDMCNVASENPPSVGPDLVLVRLFSEQVPSCQIKNICNQLASTLSVYKGMAPDRLEKIFEQRFSYDMLNSGMVTTIPLVHNEYNTIVYSTSTDYPHIEFRYSQSGFLFPCTTDGTELRCTGKSQGAFGSATLSINTRFTEN